MQPVKSEWWGDDAEAEDNDDGKQQWTAADPGPWGYKTKSQPGGSWNRMTNGALTEAWNSFAPCRIQGLFWGVLRSFKGSFKGL